MSSPENPNPEENSEDDRSPASDRGLGVERLARRTLSLARSVLPIQVAVLLGLAGTLFWNPRPLNNDILPVLPVSTSGVQCITNDEGLTVLPGIQGDRRIQDDVKDYINYYLNCDRAAKWFTDRREFNVFTFPNPVSMRVIAKDGIVLHDFPDKRPAHSRQIPTKGPGTGPSIKAWYWGHKIPGEYQTFVFEYGSKTRRLINIWAVRLSDEGGWSFFGQPHPEFFRIRGINPETGKIEEYVSMENADGPVPVKEFFWPLDFGKYPE